MAMNLNIDIYEEIEHRNSLVETLLFLIEDGKVPVLPNDFNFYTFYNAHRQAQNSIQHLMAKFSANELATFFAEDEPNLDYLDAYIAFFTIWLQQRWIRREDMRHLNSDNPIAWEVSMRGLSHYTYNAKWKRYVLPLQAANYNFPIAMTYLSLRLFGDLETHYLYHVLPILIAFQYHELLNWWGADKYLLPYAFSSHETTYKMQEGRKRLDGAGLHDSIEWWLENWQNKKNKNIMTACTKCLNQHYSSVELTLDQQEIGTVTSRVFYRGASLDLLYWEFLKRVNTFEIE